MSATHDPVAHDKAWARHFAQHGGSVPVERVTGRMPQPTPTDRQRIGEWAGRYYALPDSARLAGVE